MELIDRQGRILGKISWVDAGALSFLALLAPWFFFLVQAARPLQPRITGVTPPRAIPGERIRVEGENFEPRSEVRFAEFLGKDLEFYQSDFLLVEVPDQIAPGRYPLTVRSRRGAQTTWEKTMEILPSPPRKSVPLRVVLLLERVSPEQADRLESARVPWDGKPLREPLLVEILSQEPSGEGLKAEVVLPGEMDHWEGRPRYFYQGQRLRHSARIRLEVKGLAFSAKVILDPRPVLIPSGRERG